MTIPIGLFISSVQKELAAERRAVKLFVDGDVLLRRFFEVFLFEDLPASDRHADDVYLAAVDHCGIYVGIFGHDYGAPDATGLYPTQREFDRANPLLAESLYLAKYIERMGTGTGDMIERCHAAGLPEPEFKLTDGFLTTIRRKHPAGQVAGPLTPQVTPPVTDPVTDPVTGQVGTPRTGQVAGQVTGEISEEVRRVLMVLQRDLSRKQIQDFLSLRGRANFEERYLKPALAGQWIERTLPDKPNSRLQKYRLTAKGRAVLLRVS